MYVFGLTICFFLFSLCIESSSDRPIAAQRKKSQKKYAAAGIQTWGARVTSISHINWTTMILVLYGVVYF